MNKSANCALHGTQGIGLVCTHIARALDTGARVGFFWGDDSDTARRTHGAPNANADSAHWRELHRSSGSSIGEFKIFTLGAGRRQNSCYSTL